MDVPEPAVPFRVRPFWQAVDTGLLLFQKWPGPVLLLTAVPTLVVAVAAQTAFGVGLPWLPPVLLWWMAPLADYLLLAWVGQQFFHPLQPWTRGLVACAKVLGRSLLADLTYRRLVPWTTVLVPVSLLEGVEPRARRRRRRWLADDLRAPVVGLAAAFLLAEVAVGAMVWVTGASLLSPVLWNSSEAWPAGATSGLTWTVLVAVGQIVVAPFFSLGCFGLYINARTRREGWDLSLAFRNLRQKYRGPSAWTGLALLFVLGAGVAGRADAEAFVPPPWTGAAPPRAEAWARAVEGPEFGRTETSWTWKAKAPAKPEQKPSSDFSLPSVSWSAELLRIVALAAAGVLVAVAVGFGLVQWFRRRPTPSTPRPAPAAPAHRGPVVDRARALWAAGDHRGALAFVYQESLDQTRRRCQLTIPAAATEAAVLVLLARLEATAPRWCSVVKDVVQLWSQVAWAGIVPDEARWEGVLAAWADEVHR